MLISLAGIFCPFFLNPCNKYIFLPIILDYAGVKLPDNAIKVPTFTLAASAIMKKVFPENF